jgi:hypothetical protein
MKIGKNQRLWEKRVGLGRERNLAIVKKKNKLFEIKSYLRTEKTVSEKE